MRVTVRRARREELPRVARIFEESFTGSYRYWSIRLLDVLEVLVAEVDQVIVGAVELYVTSVTGYGRVGVISFIAVDFQYRRRGIGRQLVLAAESRFTQQGCRYSAASTKRWNTASINLFTTLGYALYERGSEVFEQLEGALYAYEDDVLLLKPLREASSSKPPP